jgi:glycosyltransferase involved in cell wall biosynthesis
MKISVDCRMIDSSGVGVYLKGCLPRFLETKNDFLLIGNGQRLAKTADRPNVSIVDCGIRPFSMTETFFPPKRLYEAVNQTDVFYSPYFNIPARIAVPVFTTIHDIIFSDMPELCPPAGLAARMWFYRRAARRSTKMFTVSRFSKSRIEHHLGTAKPVIVANSGLRERYLRVGAAPPPEIKKHILFVGNIKRHKGLSCLLEAFFGARKAGLDYRLVIAGDQKNFRTADGGAAERLRGGAGAVVFTGAVTDAELQRLLAEAALLVQPSLYEGFGLPPLEALASGTPALVSGIPALREIYADFPVTFFTAGSSDSLKDAMLRLLGGGVPPRVKLPEALRTKYTFDKTVAIIMEELR